MRNSIPKTQMYAFFKTGGKQYRAEVGRRILIERLSYEENTSFSLPGLAFEEGSGFRPVNIELSPVSEERGPKIIIFKKKRRHNYRRKKGHRQDLLCVKVEKIN
jgi:large subunit ribosomal protein L21